MEEYNTHRTGPEESSKSVHGYTNISALNEQERSQAPYMAENPFMQEFVQMMREVKQTKSTLDENFEKMRK